MVRLGEADGGHGLLAQNFDFINVIYFASGRGKEATISPAFES